MSQRVYFHPNDKIEEFFGTIVEDATTLDKAELLELIEGYDLCIVEQLGGGYAMFDTMLKKYEVRDDDA
jgi:hypothetical protein